MHHCHEETVGCGHDVNGLVRLREGLLQHNHRERRGAGAHVTRALTDCIGGHHAGAGVALGRTYGNACFQVAADIELQGSFGREEARVLASYQHLGKDVQQLPGEAARLDERVELGDHRGIVGLCEGIHGNHAAGIAYAQHFLACHLPVHVTGERGQEGDVTHVFLVVEDGLVEVRDAPAQGDVIDKELREFGSGLRGIGVAPCAEGHQDLTLVVEGHVAVHHG